MGRLVIVSSGMHFAAGDPGPVQTAQWEQRVGTVAAYSDTQVSKSLDAFAVATGGAWRLLSKKPDREPGWVLYPTVAGARGASRD